MSNIIIKIQNWGRTKKPDSYFNRESKEKHDCKRSNPPKSSSRTHYPTGSPSLCPTIFQYNAIFRLHSTEVMSCTKVASRNPPFLQTPEQSPGGAGSSAIPNLHRAAHCSLNSRILHGRAARRNTGPRQARIPSRKDNRPEKVGGFFSRFAAHTHVLTL